jgi:hypothetical protein
MLESVMNNETIIGQYHAEILGTNFHFWNFTFIYIYMYFGDMIYQDEMLMSAKNTEQAQTISMDQLT